MQIKPGHYKTVAGQEAVALSIKIIGLEWFVIGYIKVNDKINRMTKWSLAGLNFEIPAWNIKPRIDDDLK